MRTGELVGFTLALVASLCLESRAADNRPSVLFYGYAPHAEYVAKPLQAMGVQVGTCATGKLALAIANDNLPRAGSRRCTGSMASSGWQGRKSS
jgi:hypothetical protein